MAEVPASKVRRVYRAMKRTVGHEARYGDQLFPSVPAEALLRTAAICKMTHSEVWALLQETTEPVPEDVGPPPRTAPHWLAQTAIAADIASAVAYAIQPDGTIDYQLEQSIDKCAAELGDGELRAHRELPEGLIDTTLPNGRSVRFSVRRRGDSCTVVGFFRTPRRPPE